MTKPSISPPSSASLPLVLTKNIAFRDAVPFTGSFFNPPNFVRQPLWRSWYEGQFNSRTFLFFGKSWMAAASLVFFLYWTRLFDPPPKERLDKYWLNSPKFRILSAFHNPGKRPAFKISCLTYNTRYYRRGNDSPFAINEWKDHLFKLHEQLIVEQHPGAQYPYVHRQFRHVQTPDPLFAKTYPQPAELPQSGDLPIVAHQSP